MSGIRTVLDVCDVLSDDLSWRRKEISALKTAVGDREDFSEKQRTVLRAAVAMLYAHWEGFVKRSSEAYVEYVSSQKLMHADLSIPFLAQAFRAKLASASQSNKAKQHQEALLFIIDQMPRRSYLSADGVVSARGNLTSDVLRDITRTIGIDYSPYETKSKLIDTSLVGNRNRIAHGEYCPVSVSEYRELVGQVMWMLESYRDQIIEAVKAGAFRRSAS